MGSIRVSESGLQNLRPYSSHGLSASCWLVHARRMGMVRIVYLGAKSRINAGSRKLSRLQDADHGGWTGPCKLYITNRTSVQRVVAGSFLSVLVRLGPVYCLQSILLRDIAEHAKFVDMLSRVSSLLAVCLSCAAQASYIGSRQANWTIGQTVTTSSGPVEGHAGGNGTGVSEYLGIPYAQPPVGELRFQPPVAYEGTETINGTDYGFVCMQVDMFAGIPHLKSRGVEKREGTLTPDALAIIAGYFAGVPAISEDCLTLNVWTKPQVGEEKKAVLVCFATNTLRGVTSEC